MTDTNDRWLRLRNLLDRLVAPGPKASHVSASECHEIVGEVVEVLGQVRRLEAWIALEIASAAQGTLFDTQKGAYEFGVSEARRIAEGREPVPAPPSEKSATKGVPYSVGEARAYLKQERELERIDIYPFQMFTWLCDRVEELEKQLSAKMGQVEGVCSICGEKGWYVEREARDPNPSPESVIGLIGSGFARLLAGQTVLHNRDGVLICAVCRRKPQ